MGWITSAVLVGLALAGAGASAYSSSASATAQKKAAGAQTNDMNRMAEEEKARQAKLEADAAANLKEVQEAPGKAQEQARIDDMRRRAKQTKTLLTGPSGALGTAETNKKVLLGA